MPCFSSCLLNLFSLSLSVRGLKRSLGLYPSPNGSKNPLSCGRVGGAGISIYIERSCQLLEEGFFGLRHINAELQDHWEGIGHQDTAF